MEREDRLLRRESQELLNKMPNGIHAEAYKIDGRSLLFKMTEYIRKICEDKVPFPQQWRETDVTILYRRKGDRKVPSFYRGIFLMDIFGKVMATILLKRLELYTERYLSDTQFGFRKGRLTVHRVLQSVATCEV